MEPIALKLFAHIPSGAAWAFFVADEESGLLLPVVREGWEIQIRESRGLVVLDCEIDLNLEDGRFLKLRQEGGRLTCEQGFLILLESAISYIKAGRETINCVVMLDGFGGKEAE